MKYLFLATIAAFLIGCSPAHESDPVESANRAALVGIWVFEEVLDDGHARVEEIVLNADGTFASVSVETIGATKNQYKETGSWYVVGKQFKRHYKTQDGKDLSYREQGFATLDLTGVVAAGSFEGRNNIRSVTVKFQRK